MCLTKNAERTQAFLDSDKRFFKCWKMLMVTGSGIKTPFVNVPVDSGWLRAEGPLVVYNDQYTSGMIHVLTEDKSGSIWLCSNEFIVPCYGLKSDFVVAGHNHAGFKKVFIKAKDLKEKRDACIRSQQLCGN